MTTAGPAVQAAGSFLSLSDPQPAAAGNASRARIAIRRTGGSIRSRTYDQRMPPLSVVDPLAHRALEALMRAEAHVRREVAAELQRAGLSTGAFSALVVLTTAGGELELRTRRRPLGALVGGGGGLLRPVSGVLRARHASSLPRPIGKTAPRETPPSGHGRL